MWAFSEDTAPPVNGQLPIPTEDTMPVGIRKSKKFGIHNVIIECDLCEAKVDWDGKYHVSKLVAIIEAELKWMNEHMGVKSRAMINLRDFPIAMIQSPLRVKSFVEGLAELPMELRPIGLIYEEPMGEYFPEEVGEWTRCIRYWMDQNNWQSKFQKPAIQGKEELDGLLLVHVHKQWGLADAVVLDCLLHGADGIWASVAEEGAAQGHACSAITIANLARLGNKDVVSRYNCHQLANAARAVTFLTTEKEVPDRQLVYGPRAIEVVFGFSGIAGGQNEGMDVDGDGKQTCIDRFCLADFFGIAKPPVRLTMLATPEMFRQRLLNVFPSVASANTIFNIANCKALISKMKSRLKNEDSSEFNSPEGLAILWQDTFGHGNIPLSMVELLEKREVHKEHRKKLLNDAEKVFRIFVDLAEQNKANPSMKFACFYHAYLQPFFGCFTCERTRFALDCLDLDDDGGIQWSEWRYWCVWTMRTSENQFVNVDELHSTVLRLSILPASLQKTQEECKHRTVADFSEM